MQAKDTKVEIRLSFEEKQNWVRAAGGPRKVSAWARAALNLAAGNGEEALEKLVQAGAEKVLEKSKTPLSTSDMIGPISALDAAGLELPAKKIPAGSSKGRTVASDAADGGSTPPPAARSKQCPRWMHHRSGVYCGTCQKVQK